MTIHSAPVITPERRTHLPMYDMKNAAIRNPHIQWFHIDFMPNRAISVTIHIVPVMSNVDTEPDMDNASQCIRLPPRKYASRFREARLRYQNPRPMTIAK